MSTCADVVDAGIVSTYGPRPDPVTDAPAVGVDSAPTSPAPCDSQNCTAVGDDLDDDSVNVAEAVVPSADPSSDTAADTLTRWENE